MGGASALTVERTIHNSLPDCGYYEDIPIALSEWTLNTGVPMVAVADNIVGFATSATNFRVIRFDDTADAADIIRWCGCLPAQFKVQSPNGSAEHREPRLLLMVKMRLTDSTGSATANANLTLDLQMFWHNDGDTAVSTLQYVIAAPVGEIDYVDGAEEGFIWYTYDITNAMTTAQRAALENNAAVQIILGPNEAVGGSLFLDILATKLRIVRHASIAPSGEDYREARK